MKQLILAAAALLALSGAAAAQTRLGTEGAYPPFNYVDDSGNVGGFDIEVGNEVCARAALDCSWVVNEWDTLIPNLVAGNYDAIFAAMTITEERKKTIDFTEEYYPPDPSTFLVAAGKEFDFTNLTGVRIGVQGSTVQASWIDNNLKAGNTVLTFATNDQGLADLNAGNIDLLFAEKSYLDETVAGSAGALVLAGPQEVLGAGLGIGVRKADTDLLAKINDAIASMKTDGTLDALIGAYFPDREGGPFYLPDE
jgi:polar amino acid transport system substrate-binding protein